MRAAIVPRLDCRRQLLPFLQSSGGAVAVEFALILPVLISLWFGMIVFGTGFSISRKTDIAGAALGDLVGRAGTDKTNSNYTKTLMTTDLSSMFTLVARGLYPYDTTKLKLVVTSIRVQPGGTSKVTWSQAYNGGTARTVGENGSSLIPSSLVAEAGAADAPVQVIMTETSYPYTPAVGYILTGTVNLGNVSFNTPRSTFADGDPGNVALCTSSSACLY
ncbi:TadE-like protein [Faunimonas pinastri]|uniref:TadE-like protein n=1 Tax=Faunimonas pinastri TaxID=1855383 RepID=A0A1H9HIP2_9HYPH|nr:TadE/TadG family type IV pilus assembly protein [Faunimonas pinastri]SEQ62148.1 TadE-like protein [Faunimonas pinastri]